MRIIQSKNSLLGLKDEITITLKIKKGKNHSKDVWQSIVQNTLELLEKTKILQKEQTPTVLADLAYDFLKKSMPFVGDKSDIHGDCSIELHSRDNYAQVRYTN